MKYVVYKKGESNINSIRNDYIGKYKEVRSFMNIDPDTILLTAETNDLVHCSNCCKRFYKSFAMTIHCNDEYGTDEISVEFDDGIGNPTVTMSIHTWLSFIEALISEQMFSYNRSNVVIILDKYRHLNIMINNDNRTSSYFTLDQARDGSYCFDVFISHLISGIWELLSDD